MEEIAGSKNTKKRRFRLADFFIVVLCLTGAAASLYLFQADLFMTFNSGAEQAGTVSIKENTVQRRLADRNIWDRLYNNSPVYNGDLIRIAEVSSATLNLSDNNIELGENTLIRVNVTDGSTQIDFSFGNINIVSENSSKPVVLKIGERVFEASKGTVISAAVAENAETETKVQIIEEGKEPEVRFFDNEGSERLLPAVVMTQPRPQARYIKPDANLLPVNFLWGKINIDPSDKLRLEIAEDRNFSKINRILNNLDSSAVVSLGRGFWHWRISANENILNEGRFSIMDAASPAPLNPASASQIKFVTQKPEVLFQWTEVPETQFYILQVSANSNLSNPQINTQVQNTSFISSNLEEGTWYWKVEPVYPNVFQGEAVPSVVSTFSVNKQEELETLALNSPAPDVSLNVGENRSDLFFSWAGSPDAESYTISISSSGDLSNPVIRETVPDNFFVYKRDSRALRPGKYYWSVSYSDAQGKTSALTEKRSFTAAAAEIIQRLNSPADRQSIEIDELKNTNFEWRTNITNDMRLQISSSPDFSNLALNREVTGNSLTGISLPNGEWFWRISAKADSSSPVSVSRARRFTVVEPPPPPPPVQAPAPSPRPAAAVVQTQAPQPKVVPPPPKPQAQVRPQPAAAPVQKQEPPAKVEPPVQKEELPAKTEPPPLPPLPRITLVSPGQNAVLPGLTALREPTVFNWESSTAESDAAGIVSSKFILSRSPRRRTEIEIANPPHSITVDTLEEGLWYWTVEAVSKDGRTIKPEPQQLRVQPIPLLPQPANLIAEKDNRVTALDLRVNRDIVFEWDGVEEANAYIFTIYKDELFGKRQIFKTEPMFPETLANETSEKLTFTFEQLTLLDFNSKYIWQVEAVFINQEGVIEQHGAQGENTLLIDVSSPGKVQPGKAGVLYGF